MSSKSLKRSKDRLSTSNHKLQFNQLQIQSRKDLENRPYTYHEFDVDHSDNLKPDLSWQLDNNSQSINHNKMGGSGYSGEYTPYLNNQDVNQYHFVHQDNQNNKNNQNNRRQTQLSELLSGQAHLGKHNQQQQISDNYPREVTSEFNQPISSSQHRLNVKQGLNQRQLQILHNKQLSNAIYLRTQINQLLRLTTFSFYLEEQKQIKAKIVELNSAIRKIRIRSISQRRYEKDRNQQINSKYNEKITQLGSQIREKKRKMSYFGTRIALLQNYLKVNSTTSSKTSKSIYQNKVFDHKFEDEVGQISSNSNQAKINHGHYLSSKILSPQKRSSMLLPSPQPRQYYFPKKVSSILKPTTLQNQIEHINILNDYAKILRDCIEEFRNHSQNKQQIILKQKTSLRKQIQFVKLNILKIDNENRKFRAFVSHKSARSLSFTQRFRSSDRIQLTNTRLSSNQLKRLEAANSHNKISSQQKMSQIRRRNYRGNSIKLKSNPSPQKHIDEQPSLVKEQEELKAVEFSVKQSNISLDKKLSQETNTNVQDIRLQYFNN